MVLRAGLGSDSVQFLVFAYILLFCIDYLVETGNCILLSLAIIATSSRVTDEDDLN